MNPVSGEQHERAVEAACATERRCCYCGGTEPRRICPEADRLVFGCLLQAMPVADTPAAVISAYHRSLTEQGIRLVDLREVVEAIRERSCDTSQGILCSDFREAATFLERRFGSVSDGD